MAFLKANAIRFGFDPISLKRDNISFAVIDDANNILDITIDGFTHQNVKIESLSQWENFCSAHSINPGPFEYKTIPIEEVYLIEEWKKIRKEQQKEPPTRIRQWDGSYNTMMLRNFVGEDGEHHVGGFVCFPEGLVAMLQIVPETRSSLVMVYKGKLYRQRFSFLFDGYKTLEWFAQQFVNDVKQLEN